MSTDQLAKCKLNTSYVLNYNNLLGFCRDIVGMFFPMEPDVSLRHLFPSLVGLARCLQRYQLVVMFIERSTDRFLDLHCIVGSGLFDHY